MIVFHFSLLIPDRIARLILRTDEPGRVLPLLLVYTWISIASVSTGGEAERKTTLSGHDFLLPLRYTYRWGVVNPGCANRKGKREKNRRLKVSSINPNMSIEPPSVEGIITKGSPFSVEETIGRLLETIQKHGLNVFAHINHSEGAEKAGLKMQEAHVLIFGNAKAGTPLMIASPLLALDLPLKALVWQSSDGQVWVSYTSTTYLASRYSIPQELTRNIAGIDKLVEGAVQTQ